MKKLALITLISLVTSLFSFYAPVFAADDKDLVKVYNSEIIGAGDLVYHITACDKKRAYAPLRCSKKLYDYDNAIYGQCKEGEKIKEGTPVKGCILKGNSEGEFDSDPEKNTQEMIDSDSGMPRVGPLGPNCRDKPEDQGYRYLPEYAIVDNAADVEGHGEDVTIKGTIAWPSDNVPIELRKEIIPDGGKSVPLYRTNLCVTWDVTEDKTKRGAERQSDVAQLRNEDAADGTGDLLSLYDEANSEENKLIDGGCNNDNSTQEIDGISRSTPFNDKTSFSCTIKERISGKSGVDIIAKYVHAVYVWAAGLVGIVSVFTMVYSGIEISMAGGDSAKYESAKNRIVKSIMGLAILFLSGLILYTINPGFFVG